MPTEDERTRVLDVRFEALTGIPMFELGKPDVPVASARSACCSLRWVSTACSANTSPIYGVGALDLATFLIVPLLLAGAARLASYLPARRAATSSPLLALRAD